MIRAARCWSVEHDVVTLDVCRYDPVSQHLAENHVRIGADGPALQPDRVSSRLAPRISI